MGVKKQEELLDSREYEAWLSKFEVKTTDDHFTPATVYDVIKDWAVEEYGLEGRRILRPFYPGGDYESADYRDGDVVLDNPPFSIITKIVRFYESKGVDFFLFAPTLTLFGSDAKCSIVIDTHIKYHTGSNINTSFLTSLDDAKVRTAPTLKKAIKETQRGEKAGRPKFPKYAYPDNAITAARLGRVSRVDFRVYPGEISAMVRRLDSQEEAKKGLFGCGFLISERKADELRVAKLKAEELKADKKWLLSEREIELINGLD